MYLSRLTLNSRNRKVLRDLASPYEMHRTVFRAFPSAENGGPGRVLFRAEPIREGQSPIVLVQSEHEPNWSVLETDYGQAAVSRVAFSGEQNLGSETVRFCKGDRFRFRLLANPTVKRDGKRHGLFREEDQRRWLARKGRDGGFAVDSNELLVVPNGTLRSRARNYVRSWLAVRFDGLLTVTAPNAFAESICWGIGSGKAFGFGLLSIAPI